MIRIVSIKFRPAGKLYDFASKDFELPAGSQVVVETDRGRALGTVVVPPREVPRSQVPDDVKGVLRPASEQDLESARRYAIREAESLRFCQQRILDRRLEMKLVRAEYLFDGSKIVFYFTADGRIDFRELVKDLAHYFHTRIEMRQIGVRDEAKLIGGIGICGRELCCCTFLRDFAPVSVKMAKEQGLALNPNKISGQCGRLLCCLGYEFETYCHMRKGLPKCGRKVQIGDQEAEVISLDVLAQKITVRIEGERNMVIPADQIRRGEGDQPQLSAPADGQPKPQRRGRPERGQQPSRQKPAERRPPPPPPQPTPQPGPESAEEEGKKKSRRRRRRPRRKGGPAKE